MDGDLFLSSSWLIQFKNYAREDVQGQCAGVLLFIFNIKLIFVQKKPL